jgi:hypothetical protein
VHVNYFIAITVPLAQQQSSKVHILSQINPKLLKKGDERIFRRQGLGKHWRRANMDEMNE